MIGHRNHFRENDYLPLWRGPAAYNFSPWGQYDFSEVVTEDVVGMQILRGRDSIYLGQDLL